MSVYCERLVNDHEYFDCDATVSCFIADACQHCCCLLTSVDRCCADKILFYHRLGTAGLEHGFVVVSNQLQPPVLVVLSEW